MQSCVLAAYIGYSGEGDVADKLRPKCEVQATTILGPSLMTDGEERDAAGNGICVSASPDHRLAWGLSRVRDQLAKPPCSLAPVPEMALPRPR